MENEYFYSPVKKNIFSRCFVTQITYSFRAKNKKFCKQVLEINNLFTRRKLFQVVSKTCPLNLNYVTKTLHGDSIAISDAMNVFDDVIEKH